MPRKTKSSKPAACQVCAGADLVKTNHCLPGAAHRPTGGKQVHVGRVALHECQSCGHFMPTPAGQAKVDRNVNMAIRLFLGQLR